MDCWSPFLHHCTSKAFGLAHHTTSTLRVDGQISRVHQVSYSTMSQGVNAKSNVIIKWRLEGAMRGLNGKQSPFGNLTFHFNHKHVRDYGPRHRSFATPAVGPTS